MPVIKSLLQYAKSRVTMRNRPKVATGPDGQLQHGWIRGWDDLRFPATQTRRGSNNLPNFDYDNIGLLFPQNDTTERIFILAQFPHTMVLGSNIFPHIHYVQDTVELPTFKMEYRWYKNNDSVPSEWVTVSTVDAVFDYESGDLTQMVEFPEIDGSDIDTVSSLMDIIIYRDDNDVTGDVLVKEFDIHFISDNIGSFHPLTKG